MQYEAISIMLYRFLHFRLMKQELYAYYNSLSDTARFMLKPEDAADKAKSQYKDVIVGGDIWQVIDEIMIYMRNPLKYFDKRVKLPRVSFLQNCCLCNHFHQFK